MVRAAWRVPQGGRGGQREAGDGRVPQGGRGGAPGVTPGGGV
jgi:hypothetical protein